MLLLDSRNLVDDFTASVNTPRTSQLLYLRVTYFFIRRNLSASRMPRGGTNEWKFGLEVEGITTSFHFSFPMTLSSSVFLLVLNGTEVRKVGRSKCSEQVSLVAW